MPQLHLPQDHTDADLILAGQLAALIGSGELYIAWTHAGGPGWQPAVAAEIRDPLTLKAEIVEVLLACATDLWRAFMRVDPKPAGPAPGTA